MKGLLHSLRHSIRGRLVFLLLAIAAPAVLLVALLVAQAYRNEKQAVAHHMIATARAIASLVDRQNGQSESLLKGLAASHDIATGDFRSFHARASALVGGSDQWIVLTDAEGKQLA